MVELSAFWTTANNNVMGNRNHLPWEQSERVVSLLREVAKDKVLIYGSTTAISGEIKRQIDGGEYSEENRPIHIALSTIKEKIPQDYECLAGDTPDEILKTIMDKYPCKSILIIGGMNIISQFLGFCHNFYINVLDCNVQGTLVFNDKLFDYLGTTSAFISTTRIPALPDAPAIEMFHFKRSIH